MQGFWLLCGILCGVYAGAFFAVQGGFFCGEIHSYTLWDKTGPKEEMRYEMGARRGNLGL